MIKAGFANLALLSLYRTGDQVHMQGMPPNELLTFLNDRMCDLKIFMMLL